MDKSQKNERVQEAIRILEMSLSRQNRQEKG